MTVYKSYVEVCNRVLLFVSLLSLLANRILTFKWGAGDVVALCANRITIYSYYNRMDFRPELIRDCSIPSSWIHRLIALTAPPIAVADSDGDGGVAVHFHCHSQFHCLSYDCSLMVAKGPCNCYSYGNNYHRRLRYRLYCCGVGVADVRCRWHSSEPDGGRFANAAGNCDVFGAVADEVDCHSHDHDLVPAAESMRCYYQKCMDYLWRDCWFASILAWNHSYPRLSIVFCNEWNKDSSFRCHRQLTCHTGMGMGIMTSRFIWNTSIFHYEHSPCICYCSHFCFEEQLAHSLESVNIFLLLPWQLACTRTHTRTLYYVVLWTIWFQSRFTANKVDEMANKKIYALILT